MTTSVSQRLRLEHPTNIHEEEVNEYVREHFDIEENVIHGINELHVIKEYNKWIEKVNYEKAGIDLPEDIPQSAVYLAYNNLDDKLVGTIHIRYELINQKMIDRIGHIGIGIRPSERAKGYGKELIMLALEECMKINLKKVLLTCNKLNIASSNTIKKCGGILENEISIINEEGESEDVLRYWVTL